MMVLVLSLLRRFVDPFFLKRNHALIYDGQKAIALVSIRSHRLTIFPAILEALEALPTVPSDTFTAPELHGLDALGMIGSSMSTSFSRHGFTFSSEKDYLVNDGALLRQAIEADPEVLRKLEDALVIFGQYEKDILSEIKRVSSGEA
jgi:hypothetical protein